MSRTMDLKLKHSMELSGLMAALREQYYEDINNGVFESDSQFSDYLDYQTDVMSGNGEDYSVELIRLYRAGKLTWGNL